MKIHRIITTLVIAAILIAAALASGCNRPDVRSPEYQDPIADESPFQQTDEYKSLLDLSAGLGTFDEAMGEFPRNEFGMADFEPNELVQSLGLEDITEKELFSEENESMVHVHAVYEFEGGENLLEALVNSRPADVMFPAKIPQDRVVGHFSLANPGKLLEYAFDQMGESSEDTEMALGMMGLSDMEGIYNWMGTEFDVLTFTNPDYDPEAELSADNTAYFQVAGIQTDDPDGGLELATTLGEMAAGFIQMAAMISGGEVDPDFTLTEETQIDGHDAVVIRMDNYMNSSFMKDMLNEMEDQGMGMNTDDLAEVPNSIIVAAGGYLVTGDEYSINSYLEAMNENEVSTGRTASIEIETNWDMVAESFMPDSASLIPMLIMTKDMSPDMQELLQKVYDKMGEYGALGTSRFSISVDHGDELTLDLLTSKDSISLFNDLKVIVDETPEETWEELGEMISDWVMQQSGLGGMGGPGMGGPGDEDYNFKF